MKERRNQEFVKFWGKINIIQLDYSWHKQKTIPCFFLEILYVDIVIKQLNYFIINSNQFLNLDGVNFMLIKFYYIFKRW